MRREKIDLAAERKRFGASRPASEVYADLASMGLQYGEAFQGISELWSGQGEAVGRLVLPKIRTHRITACIRRCSMPAFTLLWEPRLPPRKSHGYRCRCQRCRCMSRLLILIALRPCQATEQNRRRTNLVITNENGVAHVLAAWWRRRERNGWSRPNKGAKRTIGSSASIGKKQACRQRNSRAVVGSSWEKARAWALRWCSLYEMPVTKRCMRATVDQV